MFSEEVSWLGRALNFGGICSMWSQVQTSQSWRYSFFDQNVVGSEDENADKRKTAIRLQCLPVQFVF